MGEGLARGAREAALAVLAGSGAGRLDTPDFRIIGGPRHPKARGLYEHWLASKPDGGLPRRSAFDFEDVGRLGLFGLFFVIEPVDGGADWKYRLIGSRITWLFGNEVTNVPFRQHMAPAEAEACIALSNQVARSGEPLFLMARFVSGDHSGRLETMSLPIQSPDGKGVWLVGCSLSDVLER